MDSLLNNRSIRRVVKNTLLSQKRFEDARDLTEENLREFMEGVDEELLKRMYVNGTIELDGLEAMLDYKYGIGRG